MSELGESYVQIRAYTLPSCYLSRVFVERFAMFDLLKYSSIGIWPRFICHVHISRMSQSTPSLITFQHFSTSSKITTIRVTYRVFRWDLCKRWESRTLSKSRTLSHVLCQNHVLWVTYFVGNLLLTGSSTVLSRFHMRFTHKHTQVSHTQTISLGITHNAHYHTKRGKMSHI